MRFTGDATCLPTSLIKYSGHLFGNGADRVVNPPYRVLLFSGGLDSTIAWHLLQHRGERVIPLYVNLHSRYSEKELQVLNNLPISIVLVDDAINLGDLEQEDGFVPQRNALLITYAQARYNADVVYLCAVDGEYSRDKHSKFFKQLSTLLSYTAGKPVVAKSPLAGMTKTQAVRAYLNAGWPIDYLERTVSCYDTSLLHCGRCMSCIRAWVALENNGLVFSDRWNSSPWKEARSLRKPLSNLTKLPISEWTPFARNQFDLTRALYLAWRRSA